MTDDVTAQIAALLRKLGRPPQALTPSTTLGPSGLGLTHQELIELITGLERRFGARFPDTAPDLLAAMTVSELAGFFRTPLGNPADPPTTARTLPSREDVIALLAELHGLQPHEVGEEIDSLSRTWLLHSMEQRYGTPPDIPHDQLARLTTIDGAVLAFRDAYGPPEQEPTHP